MWSLNRVLRIACWVGLALPLGAQLIYSQYFCQYALLPSIAISLFLVIPALVWKLRKYPLASIAASLTVFFWVLWENYIQCISKEGPFVAGLGVIYLLVFGFATSLVSGLLVEWLEKRMRKA